MSAISVNGDAVVAVAGGTANVTVEMEAIP